MINIVAQMGFISTQFIPHPQYLPRIHQQRSPPFITLQQTLQVQSRLAKL